MKILPLVFVLLGSTAAQAQPGQTEPVGYYVQQPVVQLQLSEEQHDLLARGEIPIGKYITGGILSYVVGFGVGHAVQGRWGEKGWIFTVGEAASMTAIIYGLLQIDHRDDYRGSEYEPDRTRDRRGQKIALAGLVGLAAFRVWGIVDAWVAPPRHNRKVRALKQQIGLAPPTYGFYLAPPQNPSASGAVAGLSLSF
ncbi:MAG: hypothetical protein H0T42_23880 [Deltaproteobacteria bacterium]|nr:hypothetical protein [Deltaproteobacteria bacterium]